MPDDVPFYEHQDDLVRIQHATLYDYRKSPDLRKALIDCSAHLTKYPFVSLLSGMDAGDGEKVLDIGLRYYSGCSVRHVNVDRALFVWEMITNEDHERPVPNVSDSLLARAYSCLAYVYFELHTKAYMGLAAPYDPSTRPSTVDYDLANNFLYVSAVYADAAARCGLISPAVLQTASWLTRIGERDGIGPRKGWRYGGLKSLWRVEAMRSREYAEEQPKKAAKIAEAPNAYTCATPGCGIEATRKKGLMRCAGRCPMERKPHYCSKECQKKDWKAHKPLCKPDEELSSGGPPSGPRVDGAPPLDKDDFDPTEELPADYEGPGRYMDVQVPGQEAIRLVSSNLTPAVMRWMRDQAEKRGR